MPKKSMECKHLNFGASVDVFRLTEEEQMVDAKWFTAVIKINCIDCGAAMQFRGVPCGVNLNNPTVSTDYTELRAPIEPENKTELSRKDIN